MIKSDLVDRVMDATDLPKPKAADYPAHAQVGRLEIGETSGFAYSAADSYLRALAIGLALTGVGAYALAQIFRDRARKNRAPRKPLRT